MPEYFSKRFRNYQVATPPTRTVPTSGDVMYGQQLSEVYELIYRNRGKDWAAEAEAITELIRVRCPGANSLLDVACGTGAHLARFRTLFEHIEGLELSRPMGKIARERLPGITVHAGDMRDFDLGRTFSAVCCLFVSISYVTSLEEMRTAVRRMVDHLVPGGVLVVEPWWFPEDFIDGYVAGDLAKENGRTVARVSHSTQVGRATQMDLRFLVGDSTGITEFAEIDYLMLFTREEYSAALADADCPAEFIPESPTGRPLFIGVRRLPQYRRSPG
ncbi:MAG: class I SAM-dependent methyltransferase [Pseudonocardiaceae bacterium]